MAAEYLHQGGTIKFIVDSPRFNLGGLCEAAEIKLKSAKTCLCGEKTRHVVGKSHCNRQAKYPGWSVNLSLPSCFG